MFIVLQLFIHKPEKVESEIWEKKQCQQYEMLWKIDVLRDCAKFTVKYQCWILFLIKFQASSLQVFSSL